VCCVSGCRVAGVPAPAAATDTGHAVTPALVSDHMQGHAGNGRGGAASPSWAWICSKYQCRNRVTSAEGAGVRRRGAETLHRVKECVELNARAGTHRGKHDAHVDMRHPICPGALHVRRYLVSHRHEVRCVLGEIEELLAELGEGLGAQGQRGCGAFLAPRRRGKYLERQLTQRLLHIGLGGAERPHGYPEQSDAAAGYSPASLPNRHGPPFYQVSNLKPGGA